MCRKNNNKQRTSNGFSLVEVLVAIAILALLAVPLAQTMISSSQINSKSKDVGVASDMSNTVIESMQSVQLGDVLTEINGYTTDNVGNKLFDLATGDGYSFLNNALKGYDVTGSYEVLAVCSNCKDRVTADDIKAKKCQNCGESLENDNAIIYEPVRRQTDAGVTSDADVTSSIKTRTTKNGAVRTYFTGNSDDIYDFVLRDVTTDEGSYDILVHLEPEQTLNLTNITSMSQSNIVNMVQKKGMEREVANEFYQNHLMYKALHPEIESHDATWFESNMTRQTQVDVRKDAIRDAAVITIKNIYSVPNDTVSKSDIKNTVVVGSYTTNSTAELAQGVYYYFYPLHNNGDVVRDNISINNPEGLALNLYFIAMEDGDRTPYKPALSLINGSADLLNICSNMDKSQWSSLPDGLTIKSLGNISKQQTLFSVDVKVYTHKESHFENDNTFVPNSKHMLVNTGATLLDSTEKFNVNVDSEIRNPIPDDPDDPDAPVNPDDPPRIDTGFSDAISKSFKYDGNEHSITENNGSYVTWEGETEATDVGQYIAYAKPTEGHTWPNGSTSKKQIVWYITPDTSAKAEKADAVYDGQEHTGVKAEHVILTGDITKKDAGNYVIYAKPESNYAWEDGTRDTHTIHWKLKPRPVTLTWEIGEGKDWWYYDGVEHHGNCIIGNVVSGDTCTPNYKDNSIKDLGSVKAIITSLSNPNYELPKEETSHIIAIKGAMVADVTMLPDTGTEQLIYNGEVQSGLKSCTGVSIGGQDKAIDAGDYVLTATPLPGYAWDKEGNDTSTKDFTWTIHHKIADIEWGETTWVYDGKTHATTCKVTNITDLTPCEVKITTTWENPPEVDSKGKITITHNQILNAGQEGVEAELLNKNYKFSSEGDRTNTLTVTLARDAWYVVNDPVIYDGKVHKWYKEIYKEEQQEVKKEVFDEETQETHTVTYYETVLRGYKQCQHISVTGTLEEKNAGTYTVTITPLANHAWSDGTTTPKTETWTINNAKMASVTWADYVFTGKTIIGVKLCGAQIGTCQKCGYAGEIPLIPRLDSNGTPTRDMILHCPKCDNENQNCPICNHETFYCATCLDENSDKTETCTVCKQVIQNCTLCNGVSQSSSQYCTICDSEIQGCPICNDENNKTVKASGSVDGSKYATLGKGQWKATNPGAYSVKVKPNKNYEWVEGGTEEKTITWNILSNTVVRPKPDGPILQFADPITKYEYNGKVRTPMISTMSGTIPLSDKYFTKNPYFKVSGTKTATNVGTYKVTISLKNKKTTCWDDGTTADIVFNWEITPREITISTVPHLGNRTYTDLRLFPAEKTAIEKAVAYEKTWDGKTFEKVFNVPRSLSQDVDGDDVAITKDKIIVYHYDCLPDEEETDPLANKHKAYFTITSDTKAFKTAGVHEYAVTAVIKDTKGVNVSKNYSISYDYAWLMIHQAPILVSDITPPKAQILTYNKKEQNLVTAGSCKYGILEYTIDGRANTSDTADWTTYNGNNWEVTDGRDNTNWSKSIPKGLYAGEYTVYYRVDADQNHYDYTNHPNDIVPVTIKRASQIMTFSPNSLKFCYGNGDVVYRKFDITSRFEEATLSISTSGAINAILEQTTVTATATGGIETCYVTVNAAQTANYEALSTDITVKVTDHNWVIEKKDGKDWIDRPSPDCIHNGTAHDICSYGCGARSTHEVPPLDHSLIYGGTKDNHKWCTKCNNIIQGNSYHNCIPEVLRAATCTEGGKTRYKCACGYYYDVDNDPKKTGHSVGKWLDCSALVHGQKCSKCSVGADHAGHVNHQGHGATYSNGTCCGQRKTCPTCSHLFYDDRKSHGHSGSTTETQGNFGTVRKCNCCGNKY